MTLSSPVAPGPDADAAKRRAALSSVLWSAFLTLIKIVAGLSTNSLGLLSEALHSALDLLAAGLTFLAVRLAAVPADSRHPYGHGKVESLSALAETGLLLATCVWIVYEAVRRLLFEAAPVEPNWWAFAVVVVSLIVDISRSAMLRRVAREHRSQALEADALHFTTDILSSAVVLIGLACVWAARWTEPGSFLHAALIRADAAAANVLRGRPLDFAKQRLEELKKLTPEDLQAVARKYLEPDRAYIIQVTP